MSGRSALRIELVQRGVALVAPLAAFGLCLAHGSSVDKDVRTLEPIVVTAQRLADERLKTQVELALQGDGSLFAGHIDVSIKNGVVTLSGLVFDDWDMRIARRVAKRIPGVKRVINDLEIKLGGE
jgi:osmotically-inducible protein OsmY